MLVADGVSTNLLPPLLAEINFIDYREQDRAAGFRLSRAISSLPPSTALPDPLPALPEVPGEKDPAQQPQEEQSDVTRG